MAFATNEKLIPVLFYNIYGFLRQNSKCSMMVIGQTVAEIWRFNSFPTHSCLPSCIFKIFIILMAVSITIPNFVAIRQNTAEVWRVFIFSKWRLATILNFYKWEILTGNSVKRVNMCHLTKFSGERFFYFSKWQLPVILIFKISKV